MANHKSSIKRARQTITKTSQNSKVRKTVRTFEKKIRLAIGEKNLATASQLFTQFQSQIGKAVQKGVFHKNNAARKISRLSSKIQKISKQ